MRKQEEERQEEEGGRKRGERRKSGKLRGRRSMTREEEAEEERRQEEGRKGTRKGRWHSPLSILGLLQEVDQISADQRNVSALLRLVGQLHSVMVLQREQKNPQNKPTFSQLGDASKVKEVIEPHFS